MILRGLVLTVGLLSMASGSGVAATPVYKCMVNGTVTFQRDPCPSSGRPKEPSVERLNVDEKKRREGIDASKANPPRGMAVPASSSPGTGASSSAAVPSARFRCDGRTYCSQMTSCEEAKYFLANCPGVKMDGDKNGIPCEKQWCR